jgi:hypothetical protein
VGSDPKLLSDALVVWTGKDVTAIPARDEALLVERFGETLAIELLPQLLHLQEDFYSSTAYNMAPDLKSIGDKAAEDFRRIHPEIGDDAVEALVWCYTWDWK